MVWQRLDRYTDMALLIMRIGIGLMFAVVHGGPKLFDGPERWARVGAAMQYVGIDFAPTFWGFMAACAEFFGGLLFLLGLFTRPAAVFLFITMFVASAMHLGRGDGWGRASHAVESMFWFLGFIFASPGKYSLDHLIAQKRRNRSN